MKTLILYIGVLAMTSFLAANVLIPVTAATSAAIQRAADVVSRAVP